jgi:hypothetical protein
VFQCHHCAKKDLHTTGCLAHSGLALASRKALLAVRQLWLCPACSQRRRTEAAARTAERASRASESDSGLFLPNTTLPNLAQILSQIELLTEAFKKRPSYASFKTASVPALLWCPLQKLPVSLRQTKFQLTLPDGGEVSELVDSFLRRNLNWSYQEPNRLRRVAQRQKCVGI